MKRQVQQELNNLSNNENRWSQLQSLQKIFKKIFKIHKNIGLEIIFSHLIPIKRAVGTVTVIYPLLYNQQIIWRSIMFIARKDKVDKDF